MRARSVRQKLVRSAMTNVKGRAAGGSIGPTAEIRIPTPIPTHIQIRTPDPDPDPPPPSEPGAYRGIPDPTDTMGYDPYADYAVDAFESGCNFSGTGTRSSPIVIDLGGARTQCGDNGVSLSGKYVILQNGSFDVTDEDGLNGGNCNFCTVRDVNFYGTQQNLGNGSVFNLGDNAVALRTEVAFFGGNTGADRENDLHGMKACGRNKWILDAHWHHLGGDSVQVGDASRCTGENIFIGGGSFHHNRENCIDIKNSTNVVASGFECYLPNNKPDEAGVVLHDDPVNPQILDSNIYDVNTGIVASGQLRNVINGNTITARHVRNCCALHTKCVHHGQYDHRTDLRFESGRRYRYGAIRL